MIRNRLASSLMIVLFCCLASGTARAAQGVALAWNQCFGDAAATQNMTFACNTNAGTHLFTGSIRLDAPFSPVVGHEIVIELASASPSLPAWWMFKNTGSCRISAMAMNTSYLASAACIDWSDGESVGGFAAYCLVTGPCVDGPTSPNVARIKLVEAVPSIVPKTLAANQDYFLFNVTIGNQKTVGLGSCSGCDVPVCIVLNSINVVADPYPSARYLTTPLAPGSNVITWQGGGVPVVSGRPSGCPAATPAHRAMWGSVKSLYR